MRKSTELVGAGIAHACDLTVRTLAVFGCANIIMGLLWRRFDGNWIWIDLHGVPVFAAWALLLSFAVGVFGYHHLGRYGRWVARAVTAAVGLRCALDAVGYYQLLSAGRIRTSFPFPASALFAVALLAWAVRPCPEPPERFSTRRAVLRLFGGGAVALVCLLLQISMFGSTDYRRPADAIVVFGAGVRPDGSPSLALRDRTRTGCEMLLDDLAGRIIFSGGKASWAPVSEPEAMRAVAVELGVPEEAILLDERGVNTRATVGNVAELAKRHGWDSLLMVSHDYHLSRIKLLSVRYDLKTFTVPARETRPLRLRHYYMLRELAAWMYYYVFPGRPPEASPSDTAVTGLREMACDRA